MTDRNQSLAIAVLGVLGVVALALAWGLLASAETPESIQAALAVAAIASNVVAAIAGFMAGRATAPSPPPEPAGE